MLTKSIKKQPTTQPPSLKSLFPHEHTLIPPLFQYLSQTHSSTPTPLIAQELEISRGIVRADIALFTDHLHGFEIKAGNDSLTRLPLQVQHYDAVFQYNWLITTPNHLKKAQTILPPWWGILIPAFETTIEPHQPSQTTPQDPLPLELTPPVVALSALRSDRGTPPDLRGCLTEASPTGQTATPVASTTWQTPKGAQRRSLTVMSTLITRKGDKPPTGYNYSAQLCDTLPHPPLKEALTVLKPAALNPSQLPLTLAKLLWREELLSSLKNLNLHKGNSTLNKQQLYKKLVLALSLPDLNNLVLHTLRNRTAWRAYPLPPHPNPYLCKQM